MICWQCFRDNCGLSDNARTPVLLVVLGTWKWHPLVTSNALSSSEVYYALFYQSIEVYLEVVWEHGITFPSNKPRENDLIFSKFLIREEKDGDSGLYTKFSANRLEKKLSISLRGGSRFRKEKCIAPLRPPLPRCPRKEVEVRDGGRD